MSVTLYTGPGKVYMGAAGIFPQEENGQIVATVNQEANKVAAGMHGRVSATQGDGTAKVALTPFDNWGLLGVLFPAFLGVKVGATAAAFVKGTRPHNPGGAGDAACVLWGNDGRKYSFPHAAITKHPDMHLGVDKPLYGGIEITALGATGVAMGTAGFLYTITESGAADPGGPMTLADFVRGRWTGVYGTVAGFGGDAGGTPIEAEDEWTISADIKYSTRPVQKLTRCYVLDSVEFMAKVRPYGPTHTQIDAALGMHSGRLLGSRFATSGIDLVLTGPPIGGTAKTITLKNADVVGAGYEFGGTKLGTGEIGFINGMTFTAGAPGSLIEFSA